MGQNGLSDPLVHLFEPRNIEMTPLSTTSLGTVVCSRIEGEGPEITRLKRMGVCSGRPLEVIRAGDPMILSVAGTRIGVSRKLARAVFVEPAELVGVRLDADGGDRENRQP